MALPFFFGPDGVKLNFRVRHPYSYSLRQEDVYANIPAFRLRLCRRIVPFTGS
jgi:hypothetical protein